MIQVVAYHGGNEEFEHFRAPAWFTSNAHHASGYAVRKGNDGACVRRVRLTIERPWCAVFTKAILLTPAEIKELVAQGYDGVLGASNYACIYCAFCPIQIENGWCISA